MTVKNRILLMLASAEYQRFSRNLEQVDLKANDVVHAPGDVVNYVYFPDDAIVSLLISVDEGRTVELAMEGNEGAVGFALSMAGASSSSVSIVRHSGSAMRLHVKALAASGNRRSLLQDLLQRYVHALFMQVAQSSVCNRFHTVDARLARWLLMTQDRVRVQELHATQAAIAQLLGVRRSSITTAARDLHRKNIINYSRGRIEILDQHRLRAASCACYGIIKRQYDSFLS